MRTLSLRLSARPLLRRAFQTVAVLLLLLAATLPTHATVVLSTNTTISYPINDHVEIIGPATVSLVAGGSISGGVVTYDNSTFNVSGGTIVGTVTAVDASAVKVTDGSLGEHLMLFNTSSATISGGSIAGIVSADDLSTIHYSGGSIGEELRVYALGVAHVYGSDLRLDEINFPDFLLTGTLVDETPLHLLVAFLKNDHPDSSIVLHEVPNLRDLADQVESLAEEGLLTGPQAHALQVKLAAAQAALAQGNEEAAAGALKAFINQVKALMRTGRLPAAEGQALIEAAEAILAGLG